MLLWAKQLLILDEADTLLDMGFRPAISRILSLLPKQRRTGLFSATQTREVKELARAGLRNPASVSVAVRAQQQQQQPPQQRSSTDNQEVGASSDEEVGEDAEGAGGSGHSTAGVVFDTFGVQATPTSLTNHYALCSPRLRPLLLLRFLHEHRNEKVMVFFLTCAAVDYWERALNSLNAEALAEVAVAGGTTAASPASAEVTSTAVQDAVSKLSKKEKKRAKQAANAAHIAQASRGAASKDGAGTGLSLFGLHGRMVQKKRNGVFAQFRAAKSVNDAPGGSGSGREGCGAVLLCTDVAARGLDVPDVDWIVQFDAPQDPAAFVHRVGRAGRAGRRGSSLLLLDPAEDAYVEFLALRKIPLEPYRAWPDLNAWWRAAEAGDGSAGAGAGSGPRAATTPADSAALVAAAGRFERRLRAAAGKDRDLLERGSRAFMAHLRAYKDHKCEFIFRFAALDCGGLASAFALLRLPKIPELKGRPVRGFVADFSVKTEDVPYLDRVRERARIKRLAVAKEATEAAARLEAERAAAEPAPKQLSGAQKKAAAKLAEAMKANPKWTADGPRKRKGKQEQIMEEWDELAKEERLYKKLRKGKISQKQFDAALKGKDEDGSGVSDEAMSEESGGESD